MEKDPKQVFRETEQMEGRHTFGKPCCEACGFTGDHINTVGSVFGAVSFPLCNVCLENYAEPWSMFEFGYEMTKGKISDFVKQLCTYDKGEDKYITWDEFVEKIKDYPPCECGEWKVKDQPVCIDC